MNSKAIRKQLLAAVAMVLVAAVALGSSTYAWFVASGTVTATGMSVKAQSEGGLAISYGGTVWGTSATAGMSSAEELYPASTLDLSNWYHATAADMDNAAAQPGSRTNITGTVFGGNGGAFSETNSYVVMKEFKIKSSSDSVLSKGLFVESVEVTGYKTMSTALRVGVKYVPASGHPEAKSVNGYIYGPVSVGSGSDNNPSNNYPVYREYLPNDPANSEKSLGTVTLATVGQAGSTLIESTTEKPGTIPSASQLTVQIYIWFEGEDANLKSTNFNPEDLSVTVNFSSISGASSSSTVELNGATAGSTAVTAKNPETGANATFYEITNRVGTGNQKLYATATGALTSTSKVYTISGADSALVATQYTKVTWTPTPAPGGAG